MAKSLLLGGYAFLASFLFSPYFFDYLFLFFLLKTCQNAYLGYPRGPQHADTHPLPPIRPCGAPEPNLSYWGSAQKGPNLSYWGGTLLGGGVYGSSGSHTLTSNYYSNYYELLLLSLPMNVIAILKTQLFLKFYFIVLWRICY